MRSAEAGAVPGPPPRSRLVTGVSTRGRKIPGGHVGRVPQQRFTLHEGNIGLADDCRRVVREVIDQHGRLDVLVNNAGIRTSCGDTYAQDCHHGPF